MMEKFVIFACSFYIFLNVCGVDVFLDRGAQVLEFQDNRDRKEKMEKG